MLTAFTRYKKMGDALPSTGRPIVYSICEWGQRQPWLWACAAGGHLWRTTRDMRDTRLSDRYDNGHNGIMNTIDKQKELEKYTGAGGWNDPGLLVTGLTGKGKSSSLNGRFTGCSLTEYRSRFSVWCMLAAPPMVNPDVRHMNTAVKAILLNKELIAIDQDVLGSQASVIIDANGWLVFKKELSNDRYAICVLNRQHVAASFSFNLECALKMHGRWNAREIFTKRKQVFTLVKQEVLSHKMVADQLGISPATVEKKVGLPLRFIRNGLLKNAARIGGVYRDHPGYAA